MFEIIRNEVNKDELNFIISSDMDLVGRLVQESNSYLKQFNITKYVNFNCVLRELIINAIEHGNKNIIGNTVESKIEHISDCSFKITVKDQGEGFDFNKLDFNVPNETDQERKRGYYIINAFSDKLEFQDKGRIVSALITISPDTIFDIDDLDEYKIIKPVGDITTNNAEGFRKILVDLLNDGTKRYKFDFEKVNDIDSISLSVLICFAKMFKNKVKEGCLEIINTNKDISDLFHLTQMDKMFTIVT